MAALIKKMLPHPDASYDALHSDHPAFRYLINYWDALFFSPLGHAHFANQEAVDALKPLHGELNHALLNRLQSEAVEIKKAIDNPAASGIPLFSAMEQLIEERPEFAPYAQHFSKRDYLPFYPLPKELVLPTKFAITEEPSPLLFENWIHLVQCLQFVEITPVNSLLLLDVYPNDLPRAQQAMTPVFLSPHRRLKEAIPLLTKALNTLSAENAPLKKDTAAADWFFRIAQRALYSINQEKYGKDRTAALVEHTSANSWNNPHKGIPEKGLDLGPAPVDYFPEIVKELSQHRLKPAKRILVTHIVPQIIDQKHAPSHLLENLLIHSNKALFNCKVIVTERLTMHGKEYPFNIFNSESSAIRAKVRLNKLSAAGFPIHLYSNMQTYLEKARSSANELQKTETDIAIFHGPDIINTMAAQLAPSPLRILFEHGTPPSHPGFDLMIASTIDAESRYKGLSESYKMEIEPLPFSIDLRQSWHKESPTPESIGLPQGCLAMTTISNHLSARLGSEMCRAIATILKRVPNAYYTPMGKIDDESKARILHTFEELGVADRVRFLGLQFNPSHIARCMKLYLNEFPFGSCIGMLDAMASGCVVISMYDPEGPPQARYGVDFMGQDRVISTNQAVDYVSLAVKLLTNPDVYKEWSEHTLKQYEKHANEKEYVQKFEEILLKHFKQIR
ncbi:MAG: hypothetical protein ACK5MA_00485 [Parachlamydiaceae bacterium]